MMKRTITLAFLSMLALTLGVVWIAHGGGIHSTVEFYRDVSVGEYQAMSGVVVYVTNSTGGSLTNGWHTNYFRVGGTNRLGRTPVGATFTNIAFGTTNLSNSIVLNWELQDGIETPVVQWSADDTTWTNVFVCTVTQTSLTWNGTNVVWTNQNFTSDYAVVPLPSVPWTNGAGNPVDSRPVTAAVDMATNPLLNVSVLDMSTDTYYSNDVWWDDGTQVWDVLNGTYYEVSGTYDVFDALFQELKDTNGVMSHDWQDRTLHDTNGSVALDYSSLTVTVTALEINGQLILATNGLGTNVNANGYTFTNARQGVVSGELATVEQIWDGTNGLINSDGSVAMAADLDMGSNSIINVDTGTIVYIDGDSVQDKIGAASNNVLAEAETYTDGATNGLASEVFVTNKTVGVSNSLVAYADSLTNAVDLATVLSNGTDATDQDITNVGTLYADYVVTAQQDWKFGITNIQPVSATESNIVTASFTPPYDGYYDITPGARFHAQFYTTPPVSWTNYLKRSGVSIRSRDEDDGNLVLNKWFVAGGQAWGAKVHLTNGVSETFTFSWIAPTTGKTVAVENASIKIEYLGAQ
jgi:hypothetical protein